jgi:hypothetical protein
MIQNILVQMGIDGAQEVAKGIDQVTAADKASEEQAKKTNEEMKAREKLLADASTGLGQYIEKLNQTKKAAAGAFGGKALKDFETQALKSFKSLIAGAKDGSKSIQGFNAQVKLLTTGALADAGISMNEFATALQEAGTSYDEFTNSLAAGVMDELPEKFEQVENKTVSLKTQLKLLKDELAAMEQQGLDGTEKFDQMAIAAGKLEDQIGDTAERVRVLSSDTANLDAAVEGVQLLATGFQIASGAAALLGVEEEELQEVLVKLNAVMAITQGLQQVGNFLTGQSAFKLKAAAIAHEIYTVAVGTSTGALRALRVALLATGIGAFIAIVYLAIEAFNMWGKSINETAESAEQFTAKLDNQKKALQDYNDELDRGAKLEAAILSARKASNKEILEAQQRVVKLKGEKARELSAKLKDDFAEIQSIDGVKTSYKDLAATIETGADLSDTFKPETIEKAKALAAAVDETDTAVKNLQTDYEVLTFQIVETERDAADKILNDTAENNKKRLDELNKLMARERAAVEGLETFKSQQRIKENLEVADNATLNEEVRTNAAKDATSEQLALAKYEAETILLNDELTATERVLIETQLHQKIIDINAEAAKRLYKIWRDNNQQIVDLKKAPDVPDATEEQANELLKITVDKLAPEVKAVEETEKKKEEIRKQATAAAFQAAQQTTDMFFEMANASRQADLDKQLEAINIAKDSELENKNLTEQQKDDINKKYAAKERQAKLKGFEEEKKMKRSQALINGLLGVTQAFATAPWPASIIFAAAVAATTALAVAKISAQQPGFKKGGYTGNKRQDEIAGFVHGQEYVATAEATRKYKPALEAMNALKFDEYLAKIAYTPRSMTPVPGWASGHAGGAIDYDRLGQSVAQHSKSPSMIMNFDEDGASAYLMEKNRQVKIKNTRYKL